MKRLPIALVVWVLAVLGAVELSSAVAGSIHSSKNSATGSDDPSSVPATASGSLMTPAGFGKALATIRSHLGDSTRAETVAIYPAYLSVDAVSGSTETDATSYTDGRFITVTSTYIPTSDPLLRLSALKAGDTAAIAARLHRVAHTPLSQIRYMIPQVDPDTHRLEWLVYLVPGAKITYFQVPAGRGAITELPAGGSPRTIH